MDTTASSRTAVSTADGVTSPASRLGSSPASLLYIPASARDRLGVRERLSRLGVPVTTAAGVADALQLLAAGPFTLCLIDLADDRAALPAIRVVRAQHPNVPVAAIVDPSNPLLAGEAIHSGVVDLLPWPFEERDIATVLANVRDRSSVDTPADPATAPQMLFVHSPAMRGVMDQVRAAAASRGGVCIAGEPGTGRELLARGVHALSRRASGAFIVVDCARLSPHELETLVFGAPGERKPAATSGAERLGRGAFLQAQGGTLYLANLVEAPARFQARLTRLLRDGEAWIAERRALADLDVRVMMGAEAGIDGAVRDGHLRGDLFERLSTVRIDAPPLRRRREDIPLLSAHFLRLACDDQHVPGKGMSRSAMAVLSALPWPGNARELRGLLETLVRSVPRPVIQLDDLLEHASFEGLAARLDSGMSLRDAKARFERDCISAVLVKHHGRVGEAAKALGIQRTNLYRKVRQLNVARSLLAARK